MNCREVEEQGVLECYLLGRLPDSQRDEFERHYFECDSCSSLLQVELTVQEHLKLLQPILPPAKKASIRRTWYWMPAFAVLTLVLVAGIWWRARQQQLVHQEASATLGTQPTSSGETQQPPLVGPSLEELARVQPPPYSVTVLRGAEDVAEFKFENAMQHYVNGGYASAIPINLTTIWLKRTDKVKMWPQLKKSWRGPWIEAGGWQTRPGKSFINLI